MSPVEFQVCSLSLPYHTRFTSTVVAHRVSPRDASLVAQQRRVGVGIRYGVAFGRGGERRLAVVVSSLSVAVAAVIDICAIVNIICIVVGVLQ